MTNTKTFDPTKPVQTRDGRKARIICTDRTGSSDDQRNLVALLRSPDGGENAAVLNSDGTYWLDRRQSGYDLVNIPVRTSTWQHVWKSSGQVYIYQTREECVKNSSSHNTALGYLRRDYVDGVFVSAEFEPLGVN